MNPQNTRTAWPYNEMRVEPEVDYTSQWRALAVRRYTALIFLYTWVPVSVAIFEVSRNGIQEPLLGGVVILLWLAIALGAVWWAGEFRCPRCRRRYGALGSKKGDMNMTRGIFDRECANCKLTKFEQRGSD